MAVSANQYANSVQRGVTWATDTIKMALLTSAYTPSLATHANFSDVSANEVTGTGYTAGGNTLTSPTNTVTAANSWGTQWTASTAYVVNSVVRPTTGNGYVYQATTAGTSSGTQPTWPTVVGQTVVDGGVTWSCAGESVVTLASAASSWPSSTFTAAYAVIYKSTGTASTSTLLGLINFGGNVSSTNGTFTVNPPTGTGVPGGWLTFFPRRNRMADIQLNGQSITTSGTAGTNAPAQGSSESWTVVALSGIPTLTGQQTYALQDITSGATTAQQAEVIRVTAATAGATSITVTRGADSTTPVAHSTGAQFAIVAVASALNALAVPNTQFFTSSGTWTKPAGITYVRVRGVAGGGGGGAGAVLATAGNSSGGAGGGGGGYMDHTFRAADLPATVSITIGTGGAGGASSAVAGTGANGGGGTATVFGTFIRAGNSGGGGGGASAAASTGGFSGTSFFSSAGPNGVSGVNGAVPTGNVNLGWPATGVAGGGTTGTSGLNGAQGNQTYMFANTAGTAGTAPSGAGGAATLNSTNAGFWLGASGGGGGGGIGTNAGGAAGASVGYGSGGSGGGSCVAGAVGGSGAGAAGQPGAMQIDCW